MGMLRRLLIGLVAIGAAALAQAPYVGTWEAEINDLPGVEVKIEEARGRLNGTVVFFFQRRGDDGKWRVEGNNAGIPMLNPKVEGKLLSFEVSHHKKHGGTELGPNVKFRFELASAAEAYLRKVDGKPDVPGTGIKLSRRK